jgi:TatD DNase family protein
MLIDTHAHVNFNAFKNSADEVIQRSLAEQTWMILVGAEYKTSRRALDYANKYETGVYASVGLHPFHLIEQNIKGDEYDINTSNEEFNYEVYEKLAQFKKVVAVGEIGLDYYHIYNGSSAQIKQKQREIFIRQLLLARNLDLPAIIHCRQAHDDMIKILKDFRKQHKELIPKERPWGVIHCFSGDEDLAWQYFSLGLLISFTGIITFSAKWDELIRKVPLEKIMLETDCPFMAPEPFRGQRNEPILVKYVAKRVAEIKNLTVDRVAEITARTARDFFRI